MAGRKPAYAACEAGLASMTSSNVRSPVRGALTSTAMLPGLCWFFHIIWWASGILPIWRIR